MPLSTFLVGKDVGRMKVGFMSLAMPQVLPQILPMAALDLQQSESSPYHQHSTANYFRGGFEAGQELVVAKSATAN